MSTYTDSNPLVLVAEFQRALLSSDTKEVRRLLRRGVMPDICIGVGEPALLVASRLGNMVSVCDLLIAGADISLTDAEKNTALHAGALSGDKDVLDALVEAFQDGGLPLNPANDAGLTPLDIAVREGNEDAVEVLGGAATSAKAASEEKPDAPAPSPAAPDKGQVASKFGMRLPPRAGKR